MLPLIYLSMHPLIYPSIPTLRSLSALQMLQQQSSGVPDLMSILSAASPLDGRRVDGDKLSRTAHIRELLEEVGR